MALTAQQEAEYTAAWAAMTAIDMMTGKLIEWVEASHNAALDGIVMSTTCEGLAPLRDAFMKRIKDIEQADELTRVKRELYEAQQRIEQLTSSGD